MSRKPVRPLALGAFAVAFLVGCATQTTPAAWLGASFADLQGSFGDPEAVLINERGNRVYVFRGRNETPGGGPTKLALGTDEVVMPNGGCAILFELEAETVSRWDWQGECDAGALNAPR